MYRRHFIRVGWICKKESINVRGLCGHCPQNIILFIINAASNEEDEDGVSIFVLKQYSTL